MVTLEQGKQTWEKGSQKKNHLEIVGLPSQHGFEKSIDTKLNSRNERNIELKLCFWDNIVLYSYWEKGINKINRGDFIYII